MPAAPSLSVIVTCHNPGTRLQATLASLWEQRWVEPQVIVVDRNSADATRDWLAASPGPLGAVVLLPEGANVAEAFAQGLGFASGEWVLLLEAGDRLVGEMVLSEAFEVMTKTEAGIVAGETAYDDGRIVRMPARVNAAAGDFVARPSTFYRRALFEENGPLDPALDGLAGYELNARLWKNRVRFKSMPLRVTASDATERFPWRGCVDEMRVRHRYFPVRRCVAWDIASVLRWLRRGAKTR